MAQAQQQQAPVQPGQEALQEALALGQAQAGDNNVNNDAAPAPQEANGEMANLLNRIAALERSHKPTVDSVKKDICQYSARQIGDYDKYQVLQKVSQLRTISQETNDKKAEYYSGVHTILQERVDKPVEQFRDYVLSLLGGKDYDRIIDSVAKIDKTFKEKNVSMPPAASTTPATQPFQPQASAPPFLPPINMGLGSPYAPYGFQPHLAGHSQHGPMRGSRRQRRFCNYCNMQGHTAPYCFSRRNGFRGPRGPLQKASSFDEAIADLCRGIGIRQTGEIKWCDIEGLPCTLATQRDLKSVWDTKNDKILGLCSYLRDSLKNPKLKPVTLYILARDLAFFSIDFFSGDRGSDLGRIKCSDILIFPDQDGFLFNQVFGKTLRGNNRNAFALKRIPESPVCPVSNLNCYLSVCKAINIDLRQGYLFRTTDRHGCISASPFIGSAIANRLRKHLKSLSIHEGETVHSFRSGCSITLASLGVSYAEIADHVGWKSTDMAKYYSQYDKVFRCSDPSTVFSAATVSKIRDKGERFKKNNELVGFKPLFKPS
eukprot:gene2618-3031_t